MKGNAGLYVAVVILVALALLILRPISQITGFFIATTSGVTSLGTWDITDPLAGAYYVYANGSQLGSGPGATTLASFYANYTNITTGEAINGSNVGCNISFNLSGSWTSPAQMWFNASSKLYTYNRTFASRSNYYWNATCYGSAQGYDNLNVVNNITVTNTPAGIYVPLTSTNCTEDAVCRYNFSQRCYDIDDIDENNLTYGYIAGTEFAGFSINTTSGNVTINITTDAGCGNFKVALTVQDPTAEGGNANKSFVVNAINDMPVIGSVPNTSYQNATLTYDINATDEETPGNLAFNFTVLSCYRPFNNQHWSTANCSDIIIINQTTGMVSRSSVFQNHDVGNYTINFTVTDAVYNLTGTNIPPYSFLANQTDSRTVNLTIIDINDRPLISTVSNQLWTQNQSVSLVIDASDIDNGTLIFNATTLYRNLSAYYNRSLFPIILNQTIYLDNGTSLGNATMNFTPVLNGQVGNYTVNISVYDGRANGTYSLLVNFTVTNINDPPNINFSCGNYAVEGLEYSCSIGQNTTDPDNFPSYVPYTDSVNSTLAYSINFTYCNKTFNASDTNCSLFAINSTTGLINYTGPLRSDSGNYTLNLSVTDGGGLTAFMLFNLTLIPDYRPNITTSVSSQITMQGQAFLLGINATDLDNATDTLAFRTQTYYTNGTPISPTKFNITTDLTSWPPGPATGVMNYTNVSNSIVGNYTIRVIVNDTWGREDYVTFNLSVYNLNDPPVLNFSCLNYTYEATYYTANRYECYAGQNTSDPDQQTPYGDNLTYSMTFVNGSQLFSINSTTGIINFSAANESWANNTLNFTYVVNITVNDSGGLTNSQTLNITVFAVNDPPVINMSNTSITANSTFFENLSADITDEENNAPFIFNVTFVNCSKTNTSDTNCSLFTINQTTGVISFYALEKDMGNYTLNVTARDSGNTTQPYNATGSRLVTFRLLPLNHAPVADIMLLFDQNWNWIPSSIFSENQTVIFSFDASDADSDTLYCTWFRNTTQIGSVSGCQDDSTWYYTPLFNESGSWTIRLEVSDLRATSYDEKTVTILNTNRPPEQIYPIQNQTWNMNTVDRNIILSYNFRDPDNENGVTNDDNNLTINYTGSQHVAVLIDDQMSPVTISPSSWTGKAIVTLTPQSDWYGIDTIVFNVNDSQYVVSSNNITLNISYTETQTQTIVQQTGGGGGAGGAAGTKIASLMITVSPMTRITSYNATLANVTFRNSGEVPLNGIYFETYVKESSEISASLDRSYVSQLGVKDSVNATLKLTTYELKKDEYEIKLTGRVTDPKFNQSATIYIRPVFNETKLEERIQLARDLFQDNPECIDLMELILQAEKELGKANLETAKDLTETALENCRDIIKYTNTTARKVTPEVEKLPLNEILIAMLTISLFTILVYLWLERRVETKKGKANA